MKTDYINNIKSILKDGEVEKTRLDKIDLLDDILLKDYKDVIYENFLDNFDGDLEMLYSKTEDLVYRLHFVINKLLVPTYNITDTNRLKLVIKDLIDNGIDLYSAVDYREDDDKELLEDFDLTFQETYEGKIRI